MSALEGFAPVTATIECEGSEHALTWRAGELELEDHDIDAERALVALGGEAPMCVDLLDAWIHAVTHDPQHHVALVNARTGGADLGQIRIQARQAHAQMIAGIAGMKRVGTPGQAHLSQYVVQVSKYPGLAGGLSAASRAQLLSALPAPLRAMLVASCVCEIEARWEANQGVPYIEYAFGDVLEGKASWALRESLRAWAPPGGLVRIPLHGTFRLEAPSATPSIAVELVGSTTLVDVGLPLRWLADVWARGIMVVDGCFVLDVLESRNGGTGLRVRAVRWERRARAFVPVVAPALVVQLDTDEWSLAWTGESPE